MNNAEAREAIRELLANWQECVKIAMAQGCTKEQAEEITGRYFTTKFSTCSMCGKDVVSLDHAVHTGCLSEEVIRVDSRAVANS